jgi:hypothetical protein
MNLSEGEGREGVSRHTIRPVVHELDRIKHFPMRKGGIPGVHVVDNSSIGIQDQHGKILGAVFFHGVEDGVDGGGGDEGGSVDRFGLPVEGGGRRGHGLSLKKKSTDRKTTPRKKFSEK